MTTKLTIKDLNCQNCTNETCDKHPKNAPSQRQIYKVRQWYETAADTIKEVGCASHPLVLQVLAASVIGELEKEEEEQIGIYQNATTMNEEVYHQGIAFGIQRGAALLKGGVQK